MQMIGSRPLQSKLTEVFHRDNADYWVIKNPAKGRVCQLLVGRVALFPLREEALLT